MASTGKPEAEKKKNYNSQDRHRYHPLSKVQTLVRQPWVAGRYEEINNKVFGLSVNHQSNQFNRTLKDLSVYVD